MNSSEKLKFFIKVILFGFFIAVVFHYYKAAYENAGMPLRTFLFFPEDYFGDFRGLKVMNSTIDPFRTTFRGFGNNYPPGAYLAVLPFTNLSFNLGLSLYVILFLSAVFYLLNCIFEKTNLALDKSILFLIMGLMTYPTLFNLDRMNAEMLIFTFCVGFFALFQKQRWAGAGFFLGLAAAAKIYPFVFVMMVPRRHWLRVFLAAGGTAVLFTLLGMVIFHVDPVDLIETYSRSHQKFSDFVFVGNQGIRWGTSLYGLFKSIFENIQGDISTLELSHKIAQFSNFGETLESCGCLKREA